MVAAQWLGNQGRFCTGATAPRCLRLPLEVLLFLQGFQSQLGNLEGRPGECDLLRAFKRGLKDTVIPPCCCAVCCHKEYVCLS